MGEITYMNETERVENWRISLGTRNNLYYNDIPYIPMFVEDIPVHVSFEDYEENGVKTIQTFGELIPKNETFATLVSLTQGNNSELPVSFKNLRVQDVYIKNSNNVYCAIWVRFILKNK